MLTVFCLLLGFACYDGDRPPNVAAPAIAAPAIAAPAITAPAIAAPHLSTAKFFDIHCDVQPPRFLSHHFWSAAQKYPLGATECELARQAQAESGFDVKAVSPAGAIGVSQFLPRTAAELGVDPWNPGESIHGQARYVLWSRGRWDPGLGGRTEADIRKMGWATYNWGAGNMYRDQRKHSWIRFHEAYPYLPTETQNYVDRIEGVER